MTLNVNTSEGSYPIIIERGALGHIGQYARLTGRRVCVVTDSGVPRAYADTVERACENPLRFCFAAGEAHKSMETLQGLLALLLKNGFDRGDALVAVGGGVVSDLCGFAAAIYMRGIDFYNVPTTLLSAVDASVGGKTAVDFGGYKNMIGAFWQPRAVIIDPETLRTLPRRRISDGLAEVIKMALSCDAALFETLESTALLPACAGGEVPAALDDIIARALAIKSDVVERDVREGGLRRVLNFGHTAGHAIESCVGLGTLYHGECVALGMLPMCTDDALRARLARVLTCCGLPTGIALDDIGEDALLLSLSHDKKAACKGICAVLVDHVGEFRFETMTPEAILARMRDCFLS